MINILWQIIAISGLVLGFGFIIFFHELGHFLAAKSVGIRVEQFAVGFGNAIIAWRKGLGFRRGTTRMEFEKRVHAHVGTDALTPLTGPQIDQGCLALGLGETEYRLNWMPLGGYVKMVGQDDMDASATSDDPRSFSQKTVGARAWVISAGVIFNVILAAILYVGLFRMGYNVAPPRVGGMLSDSPAVRAGMRVGDTILEVDGSQPHDWLALTIDNALVSGKRPFVVKVQRTDGTIEDLTIQPKRAEANGGTYALGVSQPYELRGLDPRKVNAEDLKNADGTALDPAKTIFPGEEVLAVNDVPVHDIGDIQPFDALFQSTDGTPVKLTVKQVDGGQRQVSVAPSFGASFGSGDLTFAGMTPRTQIASVQKDSPAASRLKKGDVIVGMKVGDKMIEHLSFETMRNKTADAGKLDQAVSFQILREGKLSWTSPVVPNFKTEGAKRMGMGPERETGRPVVGAVVPDSPASDSASIGTAGAPAAGAASAATAAGVPENSLITKVNGKPVANWFQVRREMIASGPKVDLEIALLDTETGQPLADTAIYHLNLSSDEQLALNNTRIAFEDPGLRPHTELRKTTSMATALAWGLQETRDQLLMLYLTLNRISTGSVSADNLAGPIGIINIGRRFALNGPDWLIAFLAMISANLAVVNFLPIPIMDGGLFTMLIFEKIRGKPLSARVQVAMQYAGLTIIMGIFLFVTYNDIRRFF